MWWLGGGSCIIILKYFLCGLLKEIKRKWGRVTWETCKKKNLVLVLSVLFKENDIFQTINSQELTGVRDKFSMAVV